MNFLRRLFYGRNGNDQLNIFLLFLSITLTFIISIFSIFNIKFYFLRLFANIPFIIYIFRAFSKNLSARRVENIKFLNLFKKSSQWICNIYKLYFGTKTHNYYKCPNCNQIVRVPKNIGKVNVICPKCKTKFTKIS